MADCEGIGSQSLSGGSGGYETALIRSGPILAETKSASWNNFAACSLPDFARVRAVTRWETMRLPLLLLSSFALLLAAASDLPPNASDFPLAQLHTLAATALSAGRSASALEIYDHILTTRSPDDFATLYKRATVRLATGALSKAKDGFHEVLKLKPFDQAHLQLARIHAKLGELDNAKLEVDAFLKMGTKSADKGALELVSVPS